MKKVFSIIAICAFALSAQAQNDDYRNVMSITAGANIFKTVAKVLIDSTLSSNSDPSKIKLTSTPTLQFAYDRGLGKVVSIGLAGSFNKTTADVQDYQWSDLNGKVSTGNYNVSLSRVSVAMRLLFHYGNSGRMDLYSGIRAGVGIWTVGATSSNPTFSFEDEFGSRAKSGTIPQFQVIPFGLRGYITENIGIGFETGIGGPYYASLTLNYRVGGSKK
jgi:hypothetical protein